MVMRMGATVIATDQSLILQEGAESTEGRQAHSVPPLRSRQDKIASGVDCQVGAGIIVSRAR